MRARRLLTAAARGPAGQTTLLLAVVGAVGLTLGVLTAYAQEWLPDELGSLANSAGSWALVAFLLALLAKDTRAAALLAASRCWRCSSATCWERTRAASRPEPR
jgi:hypothetical protein